MPSQNALKAALQEIASFSLFSDLSIEEVEKLCEGGRIETFDHKQVLFEFSNPAEYFGIVLGGAFKLSRPTPQGDEAIIYFTTPGDIIGAMIMTQESPYYPISAAAMGSSRFVKIPRKTYLNQWKSMPELLFRTQSSVSKRMTQLQSHKALLKAPLSAKIAYLLMDILNKKVNNKDLILPLPLTRREIAESLGASVESVIRIMSQWSKKGYIETLGQEIKVVRPDKIIEEMNID